MTPLDYAAAIAVCSIVVGVPVALTADWAHRTLKKHLAMKRYKA